MEEGDALADTLLSPQPIGDTELSQEDSIGNKPVPSEDPKPILELSPISDNFKDTSEKEQSADVSNPEITLVQNEEIRNVLEVHELHSEENGSMTFRKFYMFLLGGLAFLVNKVLMPFGEYVIMNTTVWVVLKCIAEVFLEMLLYIILAICYVFLKFIAQMEQKKTLKSIPKTGAEEIGAPARTG